MAENGMRGICEEDGRTYKERESFLELGNLFFSQRISL